MQEYIMSMDQGTTSSRCMIFDYQGQVAGIAQKEFTQYYPQIGWVEHNPKEIWESQLSVAKEVLRASGIKPEQIKAIGITNQRETTIVWNKNTGEPVYPAIVWQCRRTAAMVEDFRTAGFDKVIYEKTGLIADAYFSATKIKWILEEVPGAREEAEKGNLLFGTVDTWLLWNLTGGKIFATDYTNASRTMLFNIHTLEWDEELLREMNIPRSMLAEVRPSSYLYGTADEKFFGKEIAVCGIAGDQQAALFGQNCFEKGEAKNTYGTGCFLLMNTGDMPIRSDNGLLTTMAATLDDKPVYALEGSVFIAGAVVQWLRDEMGLVKNAAETEEIAESVDDTNGMYFVPAFTGLGAPYWEQNVRGTITGLTRGVNRAHFVRAALESMAYQTYDVIKAMEADSGIELAELKVDGGASNNNFLMQFQSDILGSTVVRPSVTEVTALGVAYLAGLCVGYWKDKEEIKESRRLMSDKRFMGSLDNRVIAEKLEGWKKAVATTITTAD